MHAIRLPYPPSDSLVTWALTEWTPALRKVSPPGQEDGVDCRHRCTPGSQRFVARLDTQPLRVFVLDLFVLNHLHGLLDR